MKAETLCDPYYIRNLSHTPRDVCTMREAHKAFDILYAAGYKDNEIRKFKCWKKKLAIAALWLNINWADCSRRYHCHTRYLRLPVVEEKWNKKCHSIDSKTTTRLSKCSFSINWWCFLMSILLRVLSRTEQMSGRIYMRQFIALADSVSTDWSLLFIVIFICFAINKIISRMNFMNSFARHSHREIVTITEWIMCGLLLSLIDCYWQQWNRTYAHPAMKSFPIYKCVHTYTHTHTRPNQ